MNNTPNANRKNIVLTGNRNAGKSTIFNALLGYDQSIVSNIAGTTTDPVYKASELIGFGPVRIVDTAGIDDVGELGRARIKKSEEELREADVIVHVLSIEEDVEKLIPLFEEKYKKLKKEYIIVVNKMDLREVSLPEGVLALSAQKDIGELTSRIIEKLKSTEEEKSLLEGLLQPMQTAMLVVPIDSEAPKGRLILPQVQTIRDCLDHGIRAVVVRDTELEESLKEMKVDLVITDSKIFGEVGKMVPEDVALTSFSILFARQKGDIDRFIEGAKAVSSLEDGDRILIAESCTHTVSHEDIGTVLIPNLIKKKTKKNLEFEFSYGKSLPENLEDFKMIIQCGGCMMTRNNMMNRVNLAVEKNVPITNYGVILSYFKGVFNRAVY